jgi:hypothetical protein
MYVDIWIMFDYNVNGAVFDNLHALVTLFK